MECLQWTDGVVESTTGIVAVRIVHTLHSFHYCGCDSRPRTYALFLLSQSFPPLLLLRPRVQWRSIVMSVSVCLSSSIQVRNYKSDLHRFLVHIVRGHDSVLRWRRYTIRYMYFRFMGVVMFAHNRDRKCAEIITNDAISLLFKSAISILVISNHNSFRVLFDKIASVYFISKIYLYFIIENGQSRKPALCQLYRHTFVPCGHEWAMPKKRILKVSQQSSAWICHHSVL